MDLIFGILFQFFTGLLLFSFIMDHTREACYDDKRYQRMSQVTQVIMFLTTISNLFLLIITIKVISKQCRASKRHR